MAKGLLYKPVHNKTYNKTCATSKNSDQPAHSRSLVRVFADSKCLLWPPGYPKRDKPLPYWVAVQADLSLFWSHSSYCRCYPLLSHIYVQYGFRSACLVCSGPPLSDYKIILSANSIVPDQGPVVQSIVSLKSSWVVQIVTVLVSTISNSQLFLLKKCE